MKKESTLQKVFVLLFLNIVTFCSLCSCKNLFSNNFANKNYSISGNITESDFSSLDRTAFPSSENTFYYTIKAVNDSETVHTNCSSLDPVFNIKIPHAGEWTISAEGFSDSSRTVKVLVSNLSQVLQISDENPTGSVSFTMIPTVTDGASGEVNLSFSFPGTTRPITKVDCVCVSSTKEGNVTAFNNKVTNLSVVSKKASLILNDLPSGSYTVDFYFYGTKNSNDVLYYSATQVLNVYDNLSSSKWEKNGDEEYLKDDGSGNIVFEITDAMVVKFIESTIYVDSENGDDNNVGGWVSPFETLDKAFELYRSETLKKTIYLSGNSIALTKQTSTLGNGNALAIKKNPVYEGVPKIVVSGTAANPITGSCITVLNRSGIELSDVQIVAGSNLAITGDGGAFNVSGTLSLTNVTISGFELTAGVKNGAAIYVSSTGILKLAGENHITGNKNVYNAANPVESNIYLPDGKIISITGDLAGSEIGISLEKQADITPESQIAFTSGFSTKNTQSPYTCFTSDSGYAVGWDATKKEAAVALTSGSVKLLMSEDYSLEVVSQWASQDGIKVRIFKGDTNISTFENSSDRAISYKYSITKGSQKIVDYGQNATNTNYPYSSNADSFTFLASTNFDGWTPGLYTFSLLFLSIGSKEFGYSTTFDFYVTPDNATIPLQIFKQTEDVIPSSTNGNKIAVYTKEDMELIRSYVNNGYVAADGTAYGLDDLSDVTFTLYEDINLYGSSSNKWEPIGVHQSADSGKPFNGTFDGNGHTISGYYGMLGAAGGFQGDYTGLFGYIGSSGTVKNLSIKGQFCDGSIAGYSEGKIENCKNYATIASEKTTNQAGGIVCISTNKIVNCINYADLIMNGNTTYVGGIAYKSEASSGAIIENCENYGSVSGYQDAAGIVCESFTPIVDCINYGDITATDTTDSGGKGRASGIVSYLYSEVLNCKNFGKIVGYDNCAGIAGRVLGNVMFSIRNCINEGNVISNNYYSTNTDGRVGGIVGYSANNIYLNIYNCINKGNISASFCTGGILGGCNNDYAVTITNCINTGIVKAKKEHNVSGIASQGSMIKNCLNLGLVYHESAGSKVAGISGEGYSKVLNNYYIPNVYQKYGSEDQTQVYGINPGDYASHGNSETGHADRIYPSYNSTTKSKVYETASPLTVGGVTSKDVVTLMNAWIDAQTDSSIYTKWKYSDLGGVEFNR